MKTFLGFGSRDFDDYDLFTELCYTIFYNDHEFRRESFFFTGDARGTDSMIRLMCRESGIPINVYRAYWEKYGRSAGIIRNSALAEAALRHGNGTCTAFCFWDGKSAGTKHMISYLHHKQQEVKIFRVEKINGKWDLVKEEEPVIA